MIPIHEPREKVLARLEARIRRLRKMLSLPMFKGSQLLLRGRRPRGSVKEALVILGVLLPLMIQYEYAVRGLRRGDGQPYSPPGPLVIPALIG